MSVVPLSRRWLLGLVCLLTLLGACAPRAQAQVDGDTFALPLFMSGNLGRAATYSEFTNGSFFGGFFSQALNNGGYGKELGESNHAGNVGGSSIWFAWTPTLSGTATIGVTASALGGGGGGGGGNVTNLMAVYTGIVVSNLTEVTNNRVAGRFTNSTSFPVIAGTTYRIAVDGFNAGFFFATQIQFVLTWGILTNDSFAAPTVLLGSAGVVTNSNLRATKEIGEPLHSGDVGGASVWFAWTAPLSGPASFGIQNAFFGKNALAIYTGASVGSLTLVGDNSLPPILGTPQFTNTVAFNALAGTTYRIAVDSVLNNPAGSFSLFLASQTSVEGGHFEFTTNAIFVNELESSPLLRFNLGPESRDLIGVVVTVRRTGGFRGRMLVDYVLADNTARAGIEYGNVTNSALVPVTGQVGFDDWQMSTNFVVPIIPATSTIGRAVAISLVTHTNNTFFSIFITNVMADPTPVNGITESTTLQPTFTITPQTVGILNIDNTFLGNTNGIVSMTRSLVRVSEQGRSASIDILRDGGDTTLPMTVKYGLSATLAELPTGAPVGASAAGNNNYFRLTAGSDYAMPSGQALPLRPADFTADLQSFQVTIGGGNNSATFNIPILDDTEVELNEDILVTLLRVGAAGQESPNPFAAGTTAGYALGSAFQTIVTIVADDIYGGEQPAGAADNTHNQHSYRLTSPPNNPTPGANNVVFALVVQPDQRTILAGDFTAVNTSSRNRVARLLNDGQIDTTFNPGSGADNYINAIALQPDGRILLGGGFSSYTGVSRNGVARINADGSLDATFNPGAGVNPGDVVDNAVQAIALQTDGRVVVAGNFTTFNSAPYNRVVRLTATGAADPTFNALGAGPNDRVYAVAVYPSTSALHANKILIAGAFTTVGGQIRNGLTRLNADGSVDLTFSGLGSGPNDAVFAVALTATEQILIGGAFTLVDIYVRGGVARLNPNGSVDTAFDPGTGTDNSVYAVTQQPDGAILIGGLFKSFNGTRRVGVARMLAHGVLDTSFMDTTYNHFAGITQPLSTSPNSACFALALEASGNVMIGGSFNRVGGGYGREPSLISFGTLANIGSFNIRDYSSPRLNVARLIGGATPGPGNIEFTQTAYSADEFTGSYFVQLIRTNGALGQAAVSFVTLDGTAVGSVNPLITAGFDFLHTNATPRWVSTWSINGGAGNSGADTRQLLDAVTGLNNNPQDFQLRSWPGRANVYVPILQDTIVEGNQALGMQLALPAFNSTNAPITYFGGAPIPIGLALGRSTATLTIVDDDFAYGEFTFSASSYTVSENIGSALVNVYRTNGAVGTVTVRYSATPGTASTNEFTPVSGTLTFAAGQTNRTFTVPVVDDVNVNSPTNRSVLLTLTNATGGAIIVPAGRTATLVILDNEPPAGTPAGSVNTAFGTTNGPNDKVLAVTFITNALPAQGINGRWLIGGDFTAVDGLPRSRVAMLNLDGSVNTTIFNRLGTGPNNTVSSIALHTNQVQTNLTGRIVIAGSFTQVGGTPRSRIARLNADGSLDSSFNPGAGVDNPVYAVLVQPDDKILIAGDFTTVNGSTRTRIARLNSDGTVDSTFNPGQGAGGTIRTLALDSLGRIYIGGDFTFYDSLTQNRVARLNSNGTLDTTFIDPNNTDAGANGRVRGLAIEPGGSVVLVGDFTSVGGTTNLNRIARLLSNGAVDGSFLTTGADNAVLAVAIDTATNIVVAGDFTTINGLNRSRIARITTDGRLDPTINFGTGPNNFVAAVALQPVTNGVITIGGGFTLVDGLPRNYVAQLVGGTNAGFGKLQFLAANFVAVENATSLAVFVRRVGGLSNAVSMDFETLDGTATNGTHYLTNRGKLLFQEGEAVRAYTLSIFDDAVTNVNRVFTNLLTNPTNYTATTTNLDLTLPGDITNATVTLQDNDTVLGFAFASFNANENAVGANAVITVTRTGATLGSAFVDYATSNGTATAGADYTSVIGQLTFTNGQTFTTFVVPLLDDLLVEGTETVLLQLLTPAPLGVATLGRSSAVLNIVDDDFSPGVILFTSASYSVQENQTNAVISVTRTNGVTGLVTALFTTADGTARGYAGVGLPSTFDYTNTTGTVTFGDGETSKTFTIGIINNSVADVNANRTVNLSLPSATGGASIGALSTAVLTIVDEDPPVFGNFSFNLPAYTVVETNLSVSITVNRVGGALNPVTVDFSASGGTAVPVFNYQPANLTLAFADGQTTMNVPITIRHDTGAAGDRTVNLTLGNPTGGARMGAIPNAVLTIVDNEFSPGVLSFLSDTFSVLENATNAVITVIRTNGFTGTVTVDFAASNLTAVVGIDFTTTGGTLTFGEGVTTQTFLVPIIGNLLQDGNRLLEVRLASPGGGAAVGRTNAVVTLFDDEASAGSVDGTFFTGTGSDGQINSVGQGTNGLVFIGGDFTTYNSVGRSNIARLNSSGVLDAAFVPDAFLLAGSTASVLAVAVCLNDVNAGKVVVGGSFSTVGAATRGNIVRLNLDGTVDASFSNPGADNSVFALHIQNDGKVLLGGLFTTINGVNRNFIARLNSDGSVDATFNPGSGADGPVSGIATDAVGRILIVGSFNSVNGVIRTNIARLNSDGTVDKTFDPGIGANASITCVGVASGNKPVVGGLFTTLNGVARNRIGRFNTDGSVDTTFNPGVGADEFVSTLSVQPNGKVVLGGGFASVGGLPRNRITRLNSDGSMDVTFNVGTGANGVVSTILTQTDGNIIIGGGFTSVNGILRNRVARLVGGTNFGFGAFDFASAAFTVGEEGTNALITVARSGGTSNSVGVFFSTANGTGTAGSDYTNTSGTLVFAPGVTHLTFNVPVSDNLLVDGNRTVNLALSNPTNGATLGAGARAVLTILDNDSVLGFSPLTYSVNENGTNVTVTVIRAGGTNGTVTVDFLTADGTALAPADYAATNGRLTFITGQTSATFSVSVVDNFTVGGNKTVLLLLTNASAPAIIGSALGTLTIVDNDFGVGVLGFAATNFNTLENTTNAVITVVRTNGNIGVVTVNYSTVDGVGNATSGVDFRSTNGVLIFADGEVSKTFTVPLIDDNVVEGPETVGLLLFNASSGATLGLTNALLTIVDDDDFGTFQFSTNNYTVAEAARSVTVTVNRVVGIIGAVSVDIATVAGTAVGGLDFIPFTQVLNFAPGQTSINLLVQVVDDQVVELQESFSLVLGNPRGGALLGALTNTTVTITDEDMQFSFAVTNFTVLENAGSATVSVLRYGVTNLTGTVNFATSDAIAVSGVDYLGTTSTLTFLPGVTNTNFTVSIIDNSTVQLNRFLNLSLANATPANIASVGTNAVATLTIQDNDSSFSFSASGYTISESAGSLVVSVLRFGQNTGLVSVAYSTVPLAVASPATVTADFTATAATLSFTPGQSNLTFSVPILADLLPEGDEQFGLILTNPLPAAIAASATFAFAGVNNDLTFTTKTNALVSNGVIIQFLEDGTLSGDTAVADFGITAANTVTVRVRNGLTRAATVVANVNTGPNAGLMPFTVANVAGDSGAGFVSGVPLSQISIGGAAAATQLGQTNTATVNIVDDDIGIGFSSSAYIVGESAGPATITIIRSGVTNTSVSVAFTTTNGTATNGLDYIATNAVFVFAPGVTSRTFTVPIVNDSLPEPAETVGLRLSNPSGGVFLNISNAVLTIVDNVGSLGFTAANFLVGESSPNGVVFVTRSGGSAGAITVQYLTASGGTATSGLDYADVSGTLSWTDGDPNTTKSFFVPIFNDQRIEATETIMVRLVNATPGVSFGISTATLSIVDNDGPGGVDFAFDPVVGGFDQTVFAVVQQTDGQLVAAGRFNTYNGQSHNKIARLNSDATPDTTFNAGLGADNSINALLLQPDGRFVIGGDFTSVGGSLRSRVARLQPNGLLDTSFSVGSGANGSVNALALQPDGKVIIGGGFTSYNGSVSNSTRIARLNTSGSLDTSFNTGTSGANGFVQGITLYTNGTNIDKVLVVGSFTNFGGATANRIVRLNADGTRDSTFTPGTGANSTVAAVSIQPDGKILIGGLFTSINGTPRSRVARLNHDGSLDATFFPVMNDTVLSLVVQQDGKILAGGAFTGINGDTGTPPAPGIAVSFRERTTGVTTLTTTGGHSLSIGSRVNIASVGTGFDGTFTVTAVSSATRFSYASAGADVVPTAVTPNGTFSAAGTVASRVVRFLADGTVDTLFATGTGADNLVFAVLPLSDLKVLLVGDFTVVNSALRGRIARLNGDPITQTIASSVSSLAGQLFSGALSAEPGRSYRIDFSTDLRVWTSLTTVNSGPGVLTFTDSTPPGSARRYYRAVLLP